MKTTRDVEPVDNRGTAVTVTQAPRAERRGESGPDVCSWPTMAFMDRTMVDTDAALAADPLCHLSPEGHVGRVEVRYWYFRPELTYLTCRVCSEAGDRSAIAPATVSCRHGMRAD